MLQRSDHQKPSRYPAFSGATGASIHVEGKMDARTLACFIGRSPCDQTDEREEAKNTNRYKPAVVTISLKVGDEAALDLPA